MRCNSVGQDPEARAEMRAALVRAIRMRRRAASEQASREEEEHAFAQVRAERARGRLALEHVVGWLRDAWDDVYGPVSPISGRELAYYRFVSRCLAHCVETSQRTSSLSASSATNATQASSRDARHGWG